MASLRKTEHSPETARLSKLPEEQGTSQQATPVTTLDSEIQDILSKLQVDILEVVGDNFAPKQESGSPERKKLLGMIGTIHPLKEQAAHSINQLIAQKQSEARQTDEYGNPIFFLNRYEAEAVMKLIKRLQLSGGDFNTGDWFTDVPYKIDKWLEALKSKAGESDVSKRI